MDGSGLQRGPEPDPDQRVTGKLEPIFECWSPSADGTYTAWWGYENKSKQGPERVGRTIAYGPDNHIVPAQFDGEQPERFGIPDVVPNRPGRTAYGPDSPNAFAISGWDGSPIVWTLDGWEATATTDPKDQCDGDPPPPSEPDVTVESRTYDGDGTLTRVEITAPDGSISVDELLWDPTMAIPQVVTWSNGADVDNIVYGYQREMVGGAVESYNALGDSLSSGDQWSPYGPTSGRDTLGFGYRGELEATTSVHLRARDLNAATAAFTTGDPLDGIAGTSVVTNPYHYADNDPVNRADPLGLRASDRRLNPFAAEAATDLDRLRSSLGFCVRLWECELEAQRARASGQPDAFLEVAIEVIRNGSTSGLLAYSHDGYVLDVPLDPAFSMTGIDFNVTVGPEGLSVAMVSSETPPYGWREMLGDVAMLANTVEVVNLVACGLTGVACAAVPWTAGISSALDVATLGAAIHESDWRSTTVTSASIVGGFVVAKGAKAWVGPSSQVSFRPGTRGQIISGAPIGQSEELFTAVVGGGFDGALVVAAGAYQYSDGVELDFRVAETVFAL